MRTYLVVDELQRAPGVYSAKLSDKSKEFIDKYRSSRFFRIDKIYNKIKAFTLINNKENYDLLKIDDLSYSFREKFKLPYNFNEMIYFTNSLSYKNESISLNEALNLFYNEKFFNGCFESEEHFNLIFPPNKYSELIIVNRDFVKKYFKDTKYIQLGLNVELQDSDVLVPLADISKRSWTYLTVIIRDVFDNLGAKELHIKDKTTVNSGIDAEFKKIKSLVKAEIKFETINDLQLDITRENGYYNSQATERLLPILDKYAPHFAQTAKEQIRIRRNGRFEIFDNIDLSFGVSVDVVSVFQCYVNGGFKRNFSMEVIFD